MPPARQAPIVSPEQSHELGPAAPHTYGSPIWLRANARARATPDAGAGGSAEGLGGLVGPPDPGVGSLVGEGGSVGPELDWSCWACWACSAACSAACWAACWAASCRAFFAAARRAASRAA